MKYVLILNYEYPPLGGGAATATYNLLQELKNEEDIEITLLTSSVKEYKEEIIGTNIRVVRFDIGKDNRLHDQSNKDLLKYSWQAIRWMFKHRNSYDLIHAFFGVPCGFLAMLTGKPYVVSLRGSDVPFYSEKYAFLDKNLFQYLVKLIWGRAKFVVTNSEGLRELAYETYDKKEIGVIYNGVNIDMFKPKKKNSTFSVVSTSRLIERKGLKYLIKAFRQFAKNKQDVEFILYGDGNQKEELIQVSAGLVGSKIRFMGEATREELAKSIPFSDVFVLPSLNEGMSNSLLEAMASGLAIIATDVGGTKELVDDSNGIVVEKEKSNDILEALNMLYEDRDLLESMGKSSRRKAESMNWKSMANEYVKLYKYCLDD